MSNPRAIDRGTIPRLAAVFAALLVTACAPAGEQAPVREIAITIDDATLSDGPLFDGEERTRMLIDALAAAGVNEAMFFVTTGNVERAGPAGDARIRAYAEAGVEVTLETFIEDMAEAYAWADLVVCRAGALTVAELCAVGLPAVFVPFPGAVDDHQTANAMPLARAGAAEIVQEHGLSDRSLADVLSRWLRGRSPLAACAEKARALAVPDSLSRITAVVLEQAGVPA